MGNSTSVAINNMHPCYSKEAHHKYYRLHLPVAPECNMGCNYCEKSIGGLSYHSYRPAVTKEILNPMEALHRVVLYAKKTDRLKVVGVAGPGEPLANEATFLSLELVKKQFPEMILCLSTNGILIRDSIKKILDLNIHSVSVTINSFDLPTLKKLYRHVYTSSEEKLTGDAAASYIQTKQIEAIQCLDEHNIKYKVNTILIPGINDNQMECIAKEISKHGAKLHNIIPFIPLGRLAHIKVPDCEELKEARETSAKFVEQFYLCKQCPSDAFDIPGKVK